MSSIVQNPDKTAQPYRSPVRLYKYSFELVNAAYRMLSPTCPQIPIFVGSEITQEFHSPDGAEEVTERECQLNIDATYLAKKVAGIDYAYFSQKRSLDHRKRTVLSEAANISFSNCIAVKDNCYYYVHPKNAEWTYFEQTASMHVRSLFGFKSTAEKNAVKHYSANMVGSEIMQELHSPTVAVEVTERKCQLNIDVPYLPKKVAGIDYAYFSQKTSLDRRKQTLLIEAANISFNNRNAVKKNCYYYIHPEDAERTCFDQSASMHVRSLFGIESTAEKTAVKHHSANMVGSEITQELHSADVAVEVTERKCQLSNDATYLAKKARASSVA
ncbi:Protein T23G5.2 b [Aphelenchoides avenae]|nr:Protein T23G5.2 b [Aphelenchus avenae]